MAYGLNALASLSTAAIEWSAWLWSGLSWAARETQFTATTAMITISLVYAHFQWRNARRQRINSEVAAFITRASEAQKVNESDHLRRDAEAIFFFQSPHDYTWKDEDTAEIRRRAAVHYLGDHLNLIFQAWIISGRKNDFRGPLEGWDVIAKDTMQKLLSNEQYPDYFRQACVDVLNYINSGRFYPAKFKKMLFSKVYGPRN